jgi:hypothetical protein
MSAIAINFLISLKMTHRKCRSWASHFKHVLFVPSSTFSVGRDEWAHCMLTSAVYASLLYFYCLVHLCKKWCVELLGLYCCSLIAELFISV